MRALLVVNPHATATSERTRDVLIRAIASDLKLDVEATQHRGHASALGRQAAEDGLDLVVTLGGDGTVNEVVNGLLVTGLPSGELPMLAVVPGGSANVFARSLGLPMSPVDATGEILDALRSGRRRVVGLGRANERYFAFCAGLGLDAEVVHKVEAKRAQGRRATPGLYARSAVAHFFHGADRRHPALTLERPGAEPVDHLFLGIVANTVPWTYFGRRPVNPCPRASFDTGLELLAARRLRTLGTLRTVRQMFARKPDPRGRALVLVHDASAFTFLADRPVGLQLDGDYLGEVERVDFHSTPRALTVVV